MGLFSWSGRRRKLADNLGVMAGLGRVVAVSCSEEYPGMSVVLMGQGVGRECLGFSVS